ncbi:MAG: SusC/RagA family TonB-linked outer membrane protein [Prevotella sp.]
MLRKKRSSMKVASRSLLAALFFMTGTMAFAENSITGTVKDANGNPLPGVVVKVEGTKNATVTDGNGRYSVDATPSQRLEFSYLGFVSQTLNASQSNQVVMKEDNKTLGEVVVVGYGTMRRKDVTSSITTLKQEDLNLGVVTTPGELLQGKVPGLVVTTTANPNGEPSITLRGASTLRTGEAMQPYYIVDGVPGVDLSLVSPDDIESIDVLRDATATAIYGSKAANGVIIVTTKKGSKGAAHIGYRGYLAVENVSKDVDLATADDLRNYAKENNFTLPDDQGANTDWQKEVERTGISHNHNLSVSGGTDKSNYNISLNYMNREGVLKSTDMNRLTARALAQSKVLHDRLNLALGVNYSRTENNDVPSSSERGMAVADAMIYYSPLQPVKNADGTWFSSSSVTNYYNPVSMIHEDEMNYVKKRVQITGKADLNITKGLTWTAQFSYSDKQNTTSIYHSTQSQIVKTNGEANRSTYFSNKKVFETYGNYQTTINDLHRLGFMAGYSWEESNRNDGFGVTVKDFYNDALKYYDLTYANKIDGIDAVESGHLSTLRMISFYGRANYSFADKYNIQATIRRDGSSAFGKDNRWATFPSVSASWRLSEESFIKKLNVFDNLSLHAGYGVSGNSLGFDAFTAIKTYAASGWYPNTDANGTTTNMHTIGATNNANPDLKWERTGMFNIGLDFGFFGGRLSGTVEYYDKRTSDLIYYYPVSTDRYEFATMTANVGDISNKGVELSINAFPVVNKNFKWSTSLNLSHNRNRVEKLSNQAFSVDYIDEADCSITGNTGVYTQRIMEGCPIGQFYTYEWAGYNDKGVSQFYVHDATTGERTGEVTTKPQDKDRTKTGSAQPKLTYGWNNTLNYKKWSMNVFFQGVLGNKIFDAIRAQGNCVSLIAQGKNVFKECLTDQKYGDVNAQTPSDRWIEDGSYLRLSTLTLAYDFGKIGDWVSGLSVYATCNNVFTITGFKGIDPEVDLGGLTPGVQWRNSYYPHTRTFMLGVKVNF